MDMFKGFTAGDEITIFETVSRDGHVAETKISGTFLRVEAHECPDREIGRAHV